MKSAPANFQTLPLKDAALALNGARLSGSRLCLPPDENSGSSVKAECSRMKGSPVLNSSCFRLPFPAIRRALHSDYVPAHSPFNFLKR